MARPPSDRPARFTTGELAKLIAASRNTVVRYIEEGRLRARRTAGGWYVIDRPEAVDFLWDLSFSKQTPLRIWQAANKAYETLNAEDEKAKAAVRAKGPAAKAK
jgi:excisionase family DNA binding protein